MPNNKLLTELYLGLETGAASPNETMPLCGITYFCENCLDYFVVSDGSCRKKKF
jgi:hypothetical protein